MLNFFKNKSSYFYFKLFIIIIFSLLYFPHSLILNEDLNLFMSLEIDPGSLLVSIKGLFKSPYYNMYNSYHSSQYGWTWLAINFFLILPVKILFYLLNINNEILINYFAKIIFYFINLISVLILFRLNIKILKYNNILLALTITSLYIVNNFYGLFYYLKPETTGILFFFLSIIFLIDYNQKSKKNFFYLSFCCLFLSVLTKQLFLFNAIIFSFFLFYLYLIKNNLNFYSNNLTKIIFNQFIKITILFLLIFFLVNPYAFIHPIALFKGQYILSTVFSSEISYSESIFQWIKVYSSTLYLLIPFSVNILCLIAYFFLKKKNKFYFAFIIALFACTIITLLLIPTVNKKSFLNTYLVGLLPISFLQVVFFIKLVLGYKNLIKKIILNTFFLLFFITLFFNGYSLIQSSKNRFDYKSSVQYHLFEYAKKNFYLVDKIVVDHNSGSIPEFLNKNTCHYWRECNTYEAILNFGPDYVIFSDPLPKWSWNNNLEGENLKKYVVNNKMQLHKTISSETNKNLKLLVYKKIN